MAEVRVPAGAPSQKKPLIDPRVFDSAEYRGNPYPTLKIMRDHYPVYHDKLHNCWYITRYNDVVDCYLQQEVFNTIPKGSSSGVLGNSVLELGAEEHRKRRNIFGSDIVGKPLLKRIPAIEREAAEMISAWIEPVAVGMAAELGDSCSIELDREFAAEFPIRVVAAVIGLPKEVQDKFYYWYNTMMSGLGWEPDLARAGLEARQDLEDYISPLIAQRRNQPSYLYDNEGNEMGMDILSKMCHMRIDGELLSGEEIASNIAILVGGGGETTRGAILNMWYLMLTHPEQFQQIQENPDLLLPAFHETMRHSTSVGGMPRHTSYDFNYHGQVIPGGSLVHLSTVSANHDERVFKDPEVFNIFRDDLYSGKMLRSGYRKDGRHAHLAFSVGAHFCPGAWISEQETILGSRIMLKTMKNPRINWEKMGEPPAPTLTAFLRDRLWIDFERP